MTRERFIADCNREIQELMRNLPDDDYIDRISGYIGADAGLLKAMWHAKRLALSGHFPTDLMRADNAIRLHEELERERQQKETNANTSSVR